ncbi:MAG TPA: TetR/AcrR family transcriptional regulator [Steroidobacteraceae bacterium]|nr:TetR/AcrR family transcriptional regulator [Steroidobacteraceae bacterium]
MARPADPGIRLRLRAQAVDYVLTHGIGDLALRPLAKALKTNARMLIYHFGSREGLMREILSGVREREAGRVERWMKAGRKPRTMPAFLRWYWRRISAPQARPVVRLVFELYALALRNPREFPGVLEEPVAFWPKLVQAMGVQSPISEAEATLLLAATRGLLLDLCATSDRRRTTAGLELLARLFEIRESG